MLKQANYLIGKRIKRLRIMQALKHEALALKLGISTSDMISIESGEKDVHPYYLYKLSVSFGIPLSFFMKNFSDENLPKDKNNLFCSRTQEVELFTKFKQLSKEDKQSIDDFMNKLLSQETYVGNENG
jgi:transcriptional regulator with XRE-family HTH domain